MVIRFEPMTKVQRLQNRRSALDESCRYDKAGIEPYKAEHVRKAAARAEARVRAREVLESSKVAAYPQASRYSCAEISN
ncbi:MAG: hypothetical protein CEE38_21940 [Planctomycetes bacterium B3_Pla]|nr:MAG: hypothetical protein CEE38_21940 [Planctomycetes bacterium B3_Pla]